MVKKNYIFILMLLVVSCGKDVVEIIDTPLPGDSDPDEIFEINLVGFTTDSNHDGIANVNLTILGSQQSTTDSAFFHRKQVLVGKKGIVIKAEKEGFLPSYKRVFHHRALEDVIVNLELLTSPEPKLISGLSSIITTSGGAQLTIETDDFLSNGELVFYSANGQEERMIDMDRLSIGKGVQYVNSEVVFYLHSDVMLRTGATLDVEMDISKLASPIENLSLFKYDETELIWVEVDQEIIEAAGKLKYSVEDFGWYTIGRSIETVYGALTIAQVSDTPLSNSEIVFSGVGNVEHLNTHLYTNTKGQVIKYFPADVRQEVSTNGGDLIFSIDEVFSLGSEEIKVKSTEEIIKFIDAKVYDCNLDLSNGFVGIISDNQHVVKEVKNGDFVGELLLGDAEVRFYMYDENYNLLNSRQIAFQNIESDAINFVTCSDQLRVEDGMNLLQSFEDCNVRLKPIESFIVGGVDESSIFLLSFNGDDVGERDGLLYSNISGFEVGSVNSEVKVDIRIYDEVTNIVAGFADGTFIDGTSIEMIFIGDIE